MSDRSKIEWTDATWNPIRARNLKTGGVGHFCVHASEGCRNCYAERMQPRFGNPVRYAAQDWAKVDMFLDEKVLSQPLRWKRPRMVFVCSMTDLFGDWVEDEWLDRIFAVMALAPQHTFQVLTKRPERMRQWFEEKWQGTPAREIYGIYLPAGGETGRMDRVEEACDPFLDAFGLADPSNESLWTEDERCKAMMWSWPLPNVWLGTSVEDQKTADQRIPELLATPAAVRWISAEPLLGPVDLCHLQPQDPPIEINALAGTYGVIRPHGGRGACLDWVVAGGESGPGARPMHPDWARRLRDQCANAGVPFFMKQMARKALIPEDLMVRGWPNASR